MATKVRFLRTSMGSYGKVRSGQERVVSDSLAGDLVEQGKAVIVSEQEPDPPAPKTKSAITIKGPTPQSPKKVLVKPVVKKGKK